MKLQTSNTRTPWIDIAKGYGTILVIYAHLGEGSLFTWMYSFHLPLFFFLSGYVFNIKLTFKEFLLRKIKTLVIPYFCLGIPMLLFRELYTLLDTRTFSLTEFITHVKQFILQQRLWTLWYLACLFFLNILFYILVKICQKERTIILSSILFACLGLCYYKFGGKPLYWNVDVCLTAIPFFALGYIYKLHEKQVDEYIMPKSKLYFFVFLAINLLTWRLSLDNTGLGLEMFDSNYGNPIFTYIAAFSGIFSVVILSKWYMVTPLQYIGENSMIYYAWHQTIMIPIVSKLLSMLRISTLTSYGLLGAILYKWICLIIIIACLTFANWCIIKLGLNFMIGKKK